MDTTNAVQLARDLQRHTLHGDTRAATTNPPTDPKLNRAQRRARGDYRRAEGTSRG